VTTAAALPQGAEASTGRRGDPRAFDAGGELLLLQPEALERVWPPFCSPHDPERPGYARVDGVAVVQIDGPLDQRGGYYYWQGYEMVARRVCAALLDPQIGAVALRLDSPGGVVAGCFEACDLLLKAKAAAGKKIVAIVDECAASAAYALACVADEILLPPTGLVGSVGVIATYMNYHDALKNEGIRVAILTSGKLKADGSPLKPWDDAAMARKQAEVDYLAGLFFERVAKARRMKPDAVKALEAGCFRGAAAVEAGLADREMSPADAMAHAQELAAAQRASRSLFSARASAVSPQGTLMKSIALALGLAEEASEADILAATIKLKTSGDELLAATGKPTHAEALGAVRGLVATKEAYDLLVAQRAKEQEAARATAVADIFAMAISTGRRTPAQVEAAKKSIEAKVLVLDTDEKVAAYKAEIEASPAVLPGAHAGSAGAPPVPPNEGSLVTKPFEEMSRAEKHRLYNDNPAAYAAAKADCERRQKGR
jgi:ClpP class serine protease